MPPQVRTLPLGDPGYVPYPRSPEADPAGSIAIPRRHDLHDNEMACHGADFAFLGRISPEKRVDRAIKTATACDTRLLIAAKTDPSDQRYFEERIKPLLDHPLIAFEQRFSSTIMASRDSDLYLKLAFPESSVEAPTLT